jgi:hypothetical protein
MIIINTAFMTAKPNFTHIESLPNHSASNIMPLDDVISHILRTKIFLIRMAKKILQIGEYNSKMPTIDSKNEILIGHEQPSMIHRCRVSLTHRLINLHCGISS